MTNTDSIKALVDLGPALQRLMNAATATPWGNRGNLSDRIVGPDEKTIAEFVSQALGKTGDEQDEANAIFCTFIVNNTQTILAAIEALKPMADVVEKGGCKMAWKQGFCYGDPEYYPPAAIEALTPMASGTSVVVPVAELQPFADLVSTKNDYDLSTDDEIIRSAGTYGRDYCHITVGDCRRLKDRLHRKG